jgi:NADPH:quinone reductase-like Zn-dependent oxidoreductase
MSCLSRAEVLQGSKILKKSIENPTSKLAVHGKEQTDVLMIGDLVSQHPLMKITYFYLLLIIQLLSSSSILWHSTNNMSPMMKAVMASRFGNPNDVLSIRDTLKPTLPAKKEALLIQVHACSLSPGDYRTLLGDKTVVCNPIMPYIPGGDVCGVVVEVSPGLTSQYSPGDAVVATWDMMGSGGLGEYSVVDPKKTTKLPTALSAIEGAALANSAGHALSILDRANIQQGDRVLVLGGSGGVGTILLQLLKKSKGASYVASTSTDTALLKELGVDRAINYTDANWWEDPEFIETPFDVIIDAAEGQQGWERVLHSKTASVLKGAKQGGRWVAVVFNNWHIDGKHMYQIFGLLLPPLGRQLYNMVRRTTPYYRMYLGEVSKAMLEKALTMAANKEFKAILDPDSPHAFTEEGVKEAWNLHIARKGHGKIVIQVGE